MLEVRDLSVSYGRHRALEGVALAVGRGEICVILGANGAGKSTLLKAVAGTVRPEPGATIALEGRSLLGLKPNRVVEAGVALVPEGRGIFADLTVAENLELGAHARRARRDARRTLAGVLELFPRLGERRRQAVRSMSGGEQQMVAIGRALMSRPEILMLDEPSLGLSPILTRDLFRSLVAIAATGVGILLVEQNARASLKIAGRGYLVENGHVTGEGAAAALLHDPAVIKAYLGGAAAAPAPSPPPAAPPPPPWTGGDPAAALAARAAAIHAAHTLAARRGALSPAGFAARPARPRVSAEALRVAAQAPDLAARAAARLAAHVAAGRPPPARAAADEPAAAARIGHNSAGRQIDAAELAARAGAIHTAHVAETRRRLTFVRITDAARL